jgi:hypothetical protein
VAGSAALAGDCRPASIAIGIVGVEAQVAAAAGARIVDRMALAVSDSVVIGAVPITLRIPVEVALERDESVFADADDSQICVTIETRVRVHPPVIAVRPTRVSESPKYHMASCPSILVDGHGFLNRAVDPGGQPLGELVVGRARRR